jgi:hypothetical protein
LPIIVTPFCITSAHGPILVYEKTTKKILLRKEANKIFMMNNLFLLTKNPTRNAKMVTIYIKIRLIDSIHLPKNEFIGSIPKIELIVRIDKNTMETI